MARDSDFNSYCNNLLHAPSDLMNFDNLSHDSPMEPLVYYDLQPVSEPTKENSKSICSMESNTRLPTSSADANMDTSGIENVKNKRKVSTQGSDFEDDNNEDSRSVRNDDNKKHNHSEIEKRRRDKMNSYITELASMIPTCHTMSRKLDKLTMLRMAVQHMKSIRGTVNSYTEGHYKPPFLSNQDLKNLITRAAEGFVFAVSCDHGKIIYISKSVTQVLNYLPEDLLGNNVFDYIHPKDVATVKEQLSCSDFGPRDRYINGNKMLPIRAEMINTLSKMCSGARRSFFCRMKCKVHSVKEEADTTTGSKYTQSDTSSVESKSSIISSDVRGSSQKSRDRRYSVIQCTGYLKPWTQANECHNLSSKSLDQGDDSEDNGVGADSESTNNGSCLVAVGRIINNLGSASILSDLVKPPCFTSKHTIDGKFLSVDQRVTYIVGYLPQELLGTSMYEYFHQDDISRLVDIHKATLQECKPKNTETYKFRAKNKTYVHLRSEWKSFRNPWTKDIEFIVATNILTRSDSKPDSSNKSECSSQGRPQNNYDVFTEQQLFRIQQQLGIREIQSLINSHLEANKIGRHIADTAMDAKKKTCDTGSSPLHSKHDTISEMSNNDRLNFLRSPLAVFNGPGTSSSGNGGNDGHDGVDGGIGCGVNGGTGCSVDGGCVVTHGPVDGCQGGPTVSSYRMVQDTVNQSSSTSTTNLSHAPSSIYPNSGLMIPGDSEDMLGDIMTSQQQQQLSSSDTNDEAAMAVIMSLLEADGGLGGSVDFSGLHWPLP
ncbi:protein cycle isoform X3 [Sipha flava]|uniref:Protein cycle isoform X3 n=1 Tax=Sipha flava TaxID=143950 RepID=A0A8B8FBP4_9HEMI|nr:protein cycle isoform X3 [Sipha flava]